MSKIYPTSRKPPSSHLNKLMNLFDKTGTNARTETIFVHLEKPTRFRTALTQSTLLILLILLTSSVPSLPRTRILTVHEAVRGKHKVFVSSLCSTTAWPQKVKQQTAMISHLKFQGDFNQAREGRILKQNSIYLKGNGCTFKAHLSRWPNTSRSFLVVKIYINMEWE